MKQTVCKGCPLAAWYSGMVGWSGISCSQASRFSLNLSLALLTLAGHPFQHLWEQLSNLSWDWSWSPYWCNFWQAPWPTSRWRCLCSALFFSVAFSLSQQLRFSLPAIWEVNCQAMHFLWEPFKKLSLINSETYSPWVKLTHNGRKKGKYKEINSYCVWVVGVSKFPRILVEAILLL